MPTILFLCPHGAAKSVLAAAYFARLARERNLPHTALSAGTEPDPAYSDAVLSRLDTEGLPRPDGAPRMVSGVDLAAAQRVVSLGCDLGGRDAGRVDDWSDVPPLSADFETARAAIEARVRRLVDELSRPAAP